VTLFLIAAALLTLLALSPLMYVLMRPSAANTNDDDTTASKRQALAAARAAGVLTQDEYDTKLGQLKAEVSGATAPARIAPARHLAIAIGVLVPLSLFGLYRQFGLPAAIDISHAATSGTAEVPGAEAPTLESAIASLEAKLKANPEDAEGWRLLARGQQSMQNFAGALDALKKARELAPDNIDVQVEYAEALALSTSTRRIEGEALSLLDDALQRDPTQQRALWLLGIAAVQHGDKKQAIEYWTTLRGMLEPDSGILQAVDQQLAELTGVPPAAEPSAPPATPVVSAPEPEPAGTPPAAGAVRVQVSLAPELASKVSPTAVLYVFARPANGPRMPLAIQRLPVTSLPADLVLDDSMSMMPTMKLSATPEFIIGARISQSGIANAQSGDLEGLSATLTHAIAAAPVVIRITDVVP